MNIEKAMSDIGKNGGEMVVPKVSIPTIGYSAYFKDPDGVIMGLFQSDSGGQVGIKVH